MNSGRFVLSQILDLIHRQTLDRIVDRYQPGSCIRHYGHRQQFICMVFAQMTARDGLRDIVTCLNARPENLYHLGFAKPVTKSTLADANETRDWRIWQDLAEHLIAKARPLYENEDLGVDLDNTIYALDSSTVDLALTLFPWADFRQTKAGIKMHTQIDLRGPIPTCIHISGARQHDVSWLDSLLFENGAFYLIDRGYMDFARLSLIAKSGAFFVTRAKKNLQFTRHYSQAVDRTTGLRSDHVGKPSIKKSRQDFPMLLRRVRYFDTQTDKTLVFLTNNLEIPALTVAKLYKLRWRIELFFRWIKGSPAYQALLRHECQRGEDADMDGGLHLSDDRHPPQAAQITRHTSPNFAGFERAPLRESRSK